MIPHDAPPPIGPPPRPLYAAPPYDWGQYQLHHQLMIPPGYPKGPSLDNTGAVSSPSRMDQLIDHESINNSNLQQQMR